MRNHTITTFILLGLTDDPQMKVLAFIFLFFNLHVECSWESDYYLPHPHRWPSQDSHVLVSPKFLFLGNLIHSCLYSQISVNITTADKVIIYTACAVQVFFTYLFGITEYFLLATMSFDRYVAICKPLHYVTIMNNRVCHRLIISCWMAGLLIIIPPLSLGLNLEFCDSNVIDHFFCDAAPLLKISCSDTWFIERMILVCAVLTFIMTLVCVVLSYMYIIMTILRLSSSQQRKKAFSTCSSHIVVVSITYGSCIFIYIKPSVQTK